MTGRAALRGAEGPVIFPVPMDPEYDEDALREARRALVRLRRTVEKSRRELESVVRALQGAGGEACDAAALAASSEKIGELGEAVDEQAARLRDLLLRAGLRGHTGEAQ